MNDEPKAIDLGLSRWGSTEIVIAAVAVLGILTGAAIMTWPLIDALTSRKLDNEGRAVLVAAGLICAVSAGWGMRDFRDFMRAQLLVDAVGVHVDVGGRATYAWVQIEGFDVVGPVDFMGLPSAGAIMRLRDGRRIPLARLDHLGGDGRNSERAVAEITERVATLNRLLDDATHARD